VVNVLPNFQRAHIVAGLIKPELVLVSRLDPILLLEILDELATTAGIAARAAGNVDVRHVETIENGP
jgi:hypothetical protein